MEIFDEEAKERGSIHIVDDYEVIISDQTDTLLDGKIKKVARYWMVTYEVGNRKSETMLSLN